MKASQVRTGTQSILLGAVEAAAVLALLVFYALGRLPFPIVPLLMIAWISLRLRGQGWRDIGLRRPSRWLPTICWAVLGAGAYQLLDILFVVPLLESVAGQEIDLSQFEGLRRNLPALIGSLAVSWTAAAVGEELLFRGYAFHRIRGLVQKDGLGKAVSLAITAVVFGAVHAYQGPVGVADNVLAGLLLGGLYLGLGGNLWGPILAHGFMDTIGFLILYAGLYG